MADPIVVSVEDVVKILSFADKTVALSGVLSKLTKTESDDKAVQTIKEVLDAVRPYISEQWFVDMLNMMIGIFHKKPEKEDLVKLAEAFKSMAHH